MRVAAGLMNMMRPVSSRPQMPSPAALRGEFQAIPRGSRRMLRAAQIELRHRLVGESAQQGALLAVDRARHVIHNGQCAKPLAVLCDQRRAGIGVYVRTVGHQWISRKALVVQGVGYNQHGGPRNDMRTERYAARRLVEGQAQLLSLIHISEPRDGLLSRMPSS